MLRISVFDDVGAQVKEDAAQILDIQSGCKGSLRIIYLQIKLILQFSFHFLHKLIDQRPAVREGFDLSGRASQQQFGQFPNLLRFFPDNLQIPLDLRVVDIAALLDKLGIGNDGGQRVFDVVGKAADQFFLFCLDFLLIFSIAQDGGGKEVDAFGKFGQLIVSFNRDCKVEPVLAQGMNAADDGEQVKKLLSQKEQEKDHKNNQCGNQTDVAHPAGNIGLLNVGEGNSLGLKPVINNGIGGKVQEREAEGGDDQRNKEQTENFQRQFLFLRLFWKARFNRHSIPFPMRS